MSGSSEPWSKLNAVFSTWDWFETVVAELVPHAPASTATPARKATARRRCNHLPELARPILRIPPKIAGASVSAGRILALISINRSKNIGGTGDTVAGGAELSVAVKVGSAGSTASRNRLGRPRNRPVGLDAEPREDILDAAA